MDTLWAKAANAQPKNEELHETWFTTMFVAKDFRGVQKVRKTKRLRSHLPDMAVIIMFERLL